MADSTPATPPSSSDQAEKEKILKSYDQLLYRMHLTKGARFQSAKRHKIRSNASVWAVTLLSMYVFSISAYTSIYDMESSPNLDSFLTMTNIILSAFIIAFSVMEQGKKHDLKAELFLRCAQKIQELKDEMECISLSNHHSIDQLSQYSSRYNSIVHEFSDNHSASDYMTYRINIGKLDGRYLLIGFHKFKYFMSCWSILIVTAVIMPIIFFLVFYFRLS